MLKTLVTGGAGFVGLNIVEALLRDGDEVVVLTDRPMPAYAREKLGAVHEVYADVADAGAVERAFAAHRPQRVVHAAVITAGPERESRDAGRIVAVNLGGTVNVLDAAARHGVSRVVYVSSGSAYGAALLDGHPLSEDTPARPDTLYSITKFAAERVCMRFRELRGLDVVCARLGSVFGPWERDTGVRDTLSLPFQILRFAMAGESVILSSMEARRDWIYSRDAAAAIVGLLNLDAPRHALYNVSSGLEWTGFAAAWCERLRALYPRLQWRAAEPGEASNIGFLGNRDRALMETGRLSELGLSPARDASRALDDYIAWLAENAACYETQRK